MINTPFRLGAVFTVLLLPVYFGFHTVSPDIRQASNSRDGKLEITGFENIERSVFQKLNTNQKAELEQLNKQISQADNEADKLNVLKKISGFWYDLNEFALAGSYAQKVAVLEKSDTAWQIAGTTFLYGLEGDTDLKTKQFCQQSAIHCLEQAISIKPEEPAYQIYQAMAYVKLPGEEPMKGIKMLLNLEGKYPDYDPLQLQLVELGIQTGQFEKAKSRLEKLLVKTPENPRANCLMIEVLQQLKQIELLDKYKIYCK